MNDIITPKRPAFPGWQRLEDPPKWVTRGFAGESWFYPESRLFVITALEVAAPEGGIDKGPEYHLSISRTGGDRQPQRCTSAEALWVLAQFELDGAEEDNHVAQGRVRNFWRPVAENLVGVECPCKADEPEVREEKGDYVWRGVTR